MSAGGARNLVDIRARLGLCRGSGRVHCEKIDRRGNDCPGKSKASLISNDVEDEAVEGQPKRSKGGGPEESLGGKRDREIFDRGKSSQAEPHRLIPVVAVNALRRRRTSKGSRKGL